MSSPIKTINAAMPIDYGAANGQREQLGGYFDDSAPDVQTKRSCFDPLRCTPCTRRKKICFGILVVILLLLIVIIAAVASSDDAQRVLGLKSQVAKLRSGSGCDGDETAQNQCHTGECIGRAFVCDGFRDCPGGEEETEHACKTYQEDRPVPCQKGEFTCAYTRKCISMSNRCDGKRHCFDGSDEIACFNIDDEAKLSAVKEGKSLPMSYTPNPAFGAYVCTDMGYGFLRGAVRTALETAKQCGKLDDDVRFDSRLLQLQKQATPDFLGFNDQFDAPPQQQPDDDEPEGPDNEGRIDDREMEPLKINPDMLIGNGFAPLPKIRTSSTCPEGMSVLCEHRKCGTFGEYQGPETHKTPKDIAMYLNSERPYPWVVDILFDDDQKCKGTLIEPEWVVTTSTCIDHKVFWRHDAAGGKDRGWRVVAGRKTDKPQTQSITKVMRNHFSKLDANEKNDLVLLQVEEPFVMDGYAYIACLERNPSMSYCFASGELKDNEDDDHVHVRVVVDKWRCNETDSQLAGKVTDDTMCYSFPHENDEDACIKSVGSPISCYDPMFNRWVLGGVLTEDLGCGKQNSTTRKIAIDIGEELNFNWAEIVTGGADKLSSVCGQKGPIQAVRYMRGSRQGEIYVDIGDFNGKWHTLYNLKEEGAAFDILKADIVSQQETQDARLANGSAITSKLAVTINCPDLASSICECKADFKAYDPSLGDASTLHFIDFDERNPDGSFDYDYWDDEDNLNNQLEDFGGEIPNVRLDPAQILGKNTNCSGDKSTQGSCNPQGGKDNGQECIPVEYVCDGFTDCASGVDESDEACPLINGYQCAPKAFQCAINHKCIPYEKRCDVEVDCEDQSDERGCFGLASFTKDGGLMFAARQGRDLMMSSEGFNPELANIVCSLMGFVEAMDFSEANYYSFNVSGAQDTCYKVLYPAMVNADTFLLSLVESQECDKIIRLKCRGCGNPAGIRTKKPELEDNMPAHMPWMVTVKNSASPCPATIVNSEWVIAPRDCIGETLPADMRIEGDKLESLAKDIKVVLRVDYALKTGEVPGVYNAALLRVSPAIPLDEDIHALCLDIDGIFKYPGCFVHASEEPNGPARLMRIKAQHPAICGNASLDIARNQDCVQYLHPDRPDSCLQTKNQMVQCWDNVRMRFVIAGLMTTNIGNCPDTKVKDLALVDDLSEEIRWLLAISEHHRPFDYKCDGKEFKLAFDRGNVMDTWYVTIVQNNIVYSVDWASNHTLLTVTERFRNVTELDNIVEVADGSNITSVHRMSISCPPTAKKLCGCTMTPATGTGSKIVKTFGVLVAGPEDDPELAEELEAFDENQDTPPVDGPEMSPGEEGNEEFEGLDDEGLDGDELDDEGTFDEEAPEGSETEGASEDVDGSEKELAKEQKGTQGAPEEKSGK